MSKGPPLSVVVALYDDKAQAQQTLGKLEKADSAHGARVLDAAVMTTDEAARIQVVAMSARAKTPGKIAAIFPTRIASLKAIGPAADQANDHFAGIGFERNLLKEIGENMPPNGAALVAVIEEAWVENLGDILTGNGGLARYAMETRPN